MAREPAVQKMGGGVWVVCAAGEQEVSSTESCAEGAPADLIGHPFQDSHVHPPGLWTRSSDSEFGSVPMPPQRDWGSECVHIGSSRL
eukprot:10802456-Karenia_brevis.AAC.1